MSTAAALDPHLRSWLEREVGPVDLVGALDGGITGEILHVRPHRSDDLVVRRWADDRAEHRALVDREMTGLAALEGCGIPLPRPVAADADGSASGLPTTVTTFLRGQVQLDPADERRWVRRLAAVLARLHAVPAPPLAPCERWSTEDPEDLTEHLAPDPGLARAARELAARTGTPAQPVLSHGDFQHFNVLWQQEEVSAVVDWPSVGLADRGLDVGHCRLNLAVLIGADAAMAFLEDYEELSGHRVDPAADMERLLAWSRRWQEFIPVQIAGRRTIDIASMPERVAETIARSVRRAG